MRPSWSGKKRKRRHACMRIHVYGHIFARTRMCVNTFMWCNWNKIKTVFGRCMCTYAWLYTYIQTHIYYTQPRTHTHKHTGTFQGQNEIICKYVCFFTHTLHAHIHVQMDLKAKPNFMHMHVCLSIDTLHTMHTQMELEIKTKFYMHSVHTSSTYTLYMSIHTTHIWVYIHKYATCTHNVHIQIRYMHT